MIGAYLSVSIVSFAMIVYPLNCLDGQLNCQAFTHCIIGRAIKLSMCMCMYTYMNTDVLGFYGWNVTKNGKIS